MDILDKCFLLRDSKGKTFKLFHRGESIYVSHQEGENFLEEELVLEGANSDFFAAMDDKDIIHILCQNMSGDIIYSNYLNSTWNNQTILVSKFPELYNKQFFIIPSEDTLHFFFIIKNNDAWLLVHQSKKGDSINEPQVVDYIRISSKTFTVDKDKNNNLYIFYNSLNDEFLQIGYKRFDSLSSSWSSYVQVSNSISNNSTPNILVDNENNIHAVWIRQKGSEMSIVYQKRHHDKLPFKAWGKEVIIDSIKQSCHSPFLVMIDENLCVLWNSNNNVYTSFSYDNGKTWNKPLKYDSSSLESIYSIHFSTNQSYEKSRIIAREALGNIDNSVKLAVISDLLSVSKEYAEEAAATAQEDYGDIGNIELYLESVKTYSYKIAEKVKIIEAEKKELKDELQNFMRVNSKLNEESSTLKESMELINMENQKLGLQIEDFRKKVTNLTHLFNNKDLEVKTNLNKTKELLTENTKLQEELNIIKGELNKEKNMPFYKKLFRIKSK